MKKRELGPTRRALIAGGLAAALGHGDTPERQPTGSFAEREQAARELERDGITRFQRRAYKPGISDALARGFEPLFYTGNWGRGNFINEMRRVLRDGTIGAVRNNNQRALEALEREQASLMSIGASEMELKGIQQRISNFKVSWDAWRLYLGLPQQFDTFTISHYKPAQGSEDRYYFSLQNPNEQVITPYPNEQIPAQARDLASESLPRRILFLLQRGDDLTSMYVDNIPMGVYTISRGSDERGQYVSYYDRWDLDESLEGEQGVIGQPFEIYDRIYYDPETFEPLDPQPR